MLNLNYNKVESLEGIGNCLKLEKIYLAGNSIHNIQPLRNLTKLTTLGLFRNCIRDLNDVLPILSTLNKLVELDLDGNPCAIIDTAYKHTIIRRFPRLRSLDNQTIQSLDRDLAIEYFTMEGKRDDHGEAKYSGRDKIRPSTAPTSGKLNLLQCSTSRDYVEIPGTTYTKETETTNNKKIQFQSMFSSKELNEDPILLRYVAEAVLGKRGFWCSIDSNLHIFTIDKMFFTPLRGRKLFI